MHGHLAASTATDRAGAPYRWRAGARLGFLRQSAVRRCSCNKTQCVARIASAIRARNTDRGGDLRDHHLHEAPADPKAAEPWPKCTAHDWAINAKLDIPCTIRDCFLSLSQLAPIARSPHTQQRKGQARHFCSATHMCAYIKRAGGQQASSVLTSSDRITASCGSILRRR